MRRRYSCNDLGDSNLICSVLVKNLGGLVNDANLYAPPEVKSGGWSALKTYAERVVLVARNSLLSLFFVHKKQTRSRMCRRVQLRSPPALRLQPDTSDASDRPSSTSASAALITWRDPASHLSIFQATLEPQREGPLHGQRVLGTRDGRKAGRWIWLLHQQRDVQDLCGT